jgi:hypothetical protein
MPNDDEEADIGFYYGCIPPIVVPLSQRAKDKLALTEFYDGALFLDCEPMDVLVAISNHDWSLINLDEPPEGGVIKLMNIKVLH